MIAKGKSLEPIKSNFYNENEKDDKGSKMDGADSISTEQAVSPET